MGSYHEELDFIWDQALKETPCPCGNDDNWAQGMDGKIFCSECQTRVTEQQTATVTRENKRIEGGNRNGV